MHYLGANPTIASAIKWSSQAYPTWSRAQKAQFADVYDQIRRRRFPGLSATPSITYFSTDRGEGVPAGVGVGVGEATAWQYFLAYVAQSLVVEIAGLAPWSLRTYSAAQLDQLLTTTGLFEYTAFFNTYQLRSGATPGDPERIFRFLSSNSFLRMNRRDTIGALLDWCRSNMRHDVGEFDAAGAQAHWQYNGYPPVERVISGTTHPQYGFSHWTAGCWGTTAFLSAVLRTVNIPVERVSPDGHTAPHFMNENLYLSHGDDPYDGGWAATPPIPIDQLLIDQNTYDAWFGANVPSLTREQNVGRRTIELAIQYLTDWLLKLRCNDIAHNVTNNSTSSVYNALSRYYTLSELQAMNLWSRLDERLAARGGCSVIFPSPITAAITAPADGAMVSGSVVVNMAVSGQTTAVNTFKLELSGNQLLNHAVTAVTDSYTWNTIGWANGNHTLTLTITDSAGNTATASVMVTVANMITAAITAPASGASVSGVVTVTMSVSGQTVTPNLFNLKVDNTQIFDHAVGGLSASYNWDTTTVANGPHSLVLTVRDAASKSATTNISVEVAN